MHGKMHTTPPGGGAAGAVAKRRADLDAAVGALLTHVPSL